MLAFFAIFSYVLLLALLAALAWRDIQEYILPNELNAALGITFMTFHIVTGWQIITPIEAFLGAVAGGGLLLVIRAAANRFYQEDALGLGDVKLMAAAGLGLGFPNIFLALSAGAFAGVFHGALMALWLEKKTGEKQNLGLVNVPAGLGLCVGIAIVMVTQFGFGWF